jgi:hypothetical protein
MVGTDFRELMEVLDSLRGGQYRLRLRSLESAFGASAVRRHYQST